MGATAAAARLATGLVHPYVIEDCAAGLPPAESSAPQVGEAAPPPVAGSDAPGSDEVTSEPPAAERPPSTSPLRPAPSASIAPAATASSLAAMRAELEADRAAAQVDRVAMQARLDKQAAAQAADTERIMALLAVLRPIGAPTAPLQSPSLSAPHRRAVLTNAAATVAPTIHDAVANDDSDEDEHEVRPHSHTRPQPAAVLPAFFVPTPSGTEQSAQQQLAAIVSGLSKQGTRVKYASVAEFNEALDDWVADSLRAGWTAAQIESIRAYQRFVVKLYVSDNHSLKEILEYHRAWCKAVHAGTIDMFAAGAEFNWPILYAVLNPQQFGRAAASTPPAVKTAKARSPASTASSTSSGSPAAPKFPAGSCTNHPLSTTHTTADCKKK